MKYLPLLSALIITLPVLSFANTSINQQQGPRFLDRSAEGWFWYQDPPALIEPEELPEEEITSIPVPPEPPSPQSTPDIDQIPHFSAAWFRENLQQYLDLAIDDPTPENVRTYYTMQRILMDKAQRFAEVAQFVVVGDPLLDETIQRPMSQSANLAVNAHATKYQETLVSRIADEAGLLYFFSSDCITCQQMANALHYLKERLGLEVLAVSVDGSPHPGRFFNENYVHDSGQAELLGVIPGSPAIFMLVPPDTWLPVALSPVSQEDLMKRILTVAMNHDMITRQEYRLANGLHTTDLLTADPDHLQQIPGMPSTILKMFTDK